MNSSIGGDSRNKNRLEQFKVDISQKKADKGGLSWAKYKVFLLLFLLVGAFAYMSVGILEILTSDKIIYDASCSLKKFHADNCTECLFDIKATMLESETPYWNSTAAGAEGPKTLTFHSYGWEIEMHQSYYLERLVPKEEPFRCCPSETLDDCCLFQDDGGRMCDNKDEEGCQAGPWKCQLHEPELWDRKMGASEGNATKGVLPEYLTVGHPNPLIRDLIILGVIFFFILLIIVFRFSAQVIWIIGLVIKGIRGASKYLEEDDYNTFALASKPETPEVVMSKYDHEPGLTTSYRGGTGLMEPQKLEYMYICDHAQKDVVKRVGFSRVEYQPGDRLEILTVIIRPGENVKAPTFSTSKNIKDDKIFPKSQKTQNIPDTGTRPLITSVEGLLHDRGVTAKHALRCVGDVPVDRRHSSSMRHIDWFNPGPEPKFAVFIAQIVGYEKMTTSADDLKWAKMYEKLGRQPTRIPAQFALPEREYSEEAIADFIQNSLGGTMTTIGFPSISDSERTTNESKGRQKTKRSSHQKKKDRKKAASMPLDSTKAETVWRIPSMIEDDSEKAEGP